MTGYSELKGGSATSFFSLSNDIMRFTRYFTFSRIDPLSDDYNLLFQTSERIDAVLVFKTISHRQNRYRVIGFLVLRGRPTCLEDICRCLPNFLVGFLDPRWETGIQWLSSFEAVPIFHNYKRHPFSAIKCRLFRNDSVEE